MPQALPISQYASILGVRTDANLNQLKAAYKDAAHKYHPDNGGSVEAFQMVQEAFAAIQEHQHAQQWGTSSSAIGSHVKEQPKLIELKR